MHLHFLIVVPVVFTDISQMAPTPALTYASLRQSLRKSSSLSPVYILHGEESYYIDELTKEFENLVPEDERAFNLFILYGHGLTAQKIVDVAGGFPLMSDRLVVVVREAQLMNANEINKLSDYLRTPNPSTVLIIAFRGVQAKGKDFLTAAKTNTVVVFEAKKLKESAVGPVLESIIKEKGLHIEAKGLEMLKDYIGTDLAKLYNEINKMALVLGPGATITPQSIEHNIGISREFNNFELIDAIARRDTVRAFRISEYFRRNPKNCPTITTASSLFSFFANLMIYHFTPDKSPGSLMTALGLKWQGQLKNFETGARNYNAWRTIEIISAIRTFDVQSKGVGSRMDQYDLLDTLLFKIFAAQGNINI